MAERLKLIAAIDSLRESPWAGGALKGEFQGLRRLRVGSYRIVYEWRQQEPLVLVLRIGHRQGVYR